MGRLIKLGDKEFTEEEMMAIVAKNEEIRITDQIADSLLAAYQKGEGLALQIAIPMSHDDIKQMVQPEHPMLPYLVQRVLAEDLRIRVMSHLGMVVERIREKLGTLPPGGEGASAEEHDPGQIAVGSAEAEIDPQLAAAAQAAMAVLAGANGAMEVPGKVEATGALSVARADGSKD